MIHFIFHGSQKVFKEQLNLPWRTLFHHTMPFHASLGAYTVSRQRGGLSDLTSLIFLSIHRSSILLTGVLPSAYTIITEMILSQYPLQLWWTFFCCLQTWEYLMSYLWHALFAPQPSPHGEFPFFFFFGGVSIEKVGLIPLPLGFMHPSYGVLSPQNSFLLQTKPRSMSPAYTEVTVLTSSSFLFVCLHSTLKNSIIWRVFSFRTISLKALVLRDLNLCMACCGDCCSILPLRPLAA